MRSTAHTAAENTSPFPRSSRLAASHLRGAGKSRVGGGPLCGPCSSGRKDRSGCRLECPRGPGHGLVHAPGRAHAQWVGEADAVLSRPCPAQGLAHSRCSAVLLPSYGWDMPSHAPLWAPCPNPSSIFTWPTSHLQAQVSSNASSRSLLRSLLPFFHTSLITSFMKVISSHNSTI